MLVLSRAKSMKTSGQNIEIEVLEIRGHVVRIVIKDPRGSR